MNRIKPLKKKSLKGWAHSLLLFYYEHAVWKTAFRSQKQDPLGPWSFQLLEPQKQMRIVYKLIITVYFVVSKERNNLKQSSRN